MLHFLISLFLIPHVWLFEIKMISYDFSDKGNGTKQTKSKTKQLMTLRAFHLIS